MTDVTATTSSVANHALKLTVRRPGVRRPLTMGRVRFTYDGTSVSAVGYRTGDVIEGGQVASIVSTGGCGCGGRLGLRFTLTTGEEWNV